ncbi:hypothetical protein [Algihabitans albus]|uniref:hypothetical protein n=1 Tax=Algihabitans albus TaxID=2164067 RepID=UPI000E5C5824|nr:hypothetical protein [Algihabitans albus]
MTRDSESSATAAEGERPFVSGAEDGFGLTVEVPGGVTSPGAEADDDAGSGDRFGESAKSNGAEEESDYRFDLPPDVMPDGGVPAGLDAERLEAFKPLARELKLSNAQAQKLVDLHARALKQGTDLLMQRHAETVEDWTRQTRADPEIGGDKLEETLRLGNAAVQHAFDAPTIELLKHFGLLNHPGFIRGLRGFGRIVSDDHFVESSGTAAPRSRAERMYPDMPKPQR